MQNSDICLHYCRFIILPHSPTCPVFPYNYTTTLLRAFLLTHFLISNYVRHTKRSNDSKETQLLIKELTYQTTPRNSSSMRQITLIMQHRNPDGNDTFHGMAIIAMVTPGTTQSHPVKRGTVLPDDVSTHGHMRIQ